MNAGALPDNRLAAVDHGLFKQHHAIGRNLVIQVLWVYDHPVDLNGVRRFQQNLGRGLLGRRIERSPLPFARHHWVLDRGPSDIHIYEPAHSRAEITEWADEHAQSPIDPERGPGWHMGVLPVADGSTAISLALSHYLLDGLGLVLALIEAVMGDKRNLGYPPPRSRPPGRAIAQDSRQTVRDAPEVVRALRAAAAQARRQRQQVAERTAVAPPANVSVNDVDDRVVVPGITLSIDITEWETRAKALGGTSNTLGAAFAAKLGERIGRRRIGDGAVTLELPLNERVEGDTRANAMSFVRVTLDPTHLAGDLRDARAAIKQSLTTGQHAPNDMSQIAWLAAFTPKRTFRRMDDAIMADPDSPVFYSNLGDVGAMVITIDGTAAEFATARVIAQHESRRWLERTGGQMILQAWRLPGTFAFSINAYQPGAVNSKPALRELAAQTLAEFGLTAEIN